MSYTLTTFLDRFKPYVLKDMQTSGIPASLTTAQAIIESNKGNSGLTTKANNLFGIKGKYNGQSVSMMTTEYYNGVKHRVMQDFRKYPSWLESINDHSAMFNRMKRYENLRNCQDYEEACMNVQKDGYATAPDYAQTLMKAVKKNKLWLLDYEVLKNYAPSKLRTVRQGADGGGVYLLQTLLTAKGYKLDCDGQFGGQTDYCLRAYQEKNGLTIDGICGPKTWTELKK